MKKLNLITLLLVIILAVSACGSPTEAPQAATEAPTTEAAAPLGKLVSTNGVEFTIPPELGLDATSGIIPEVPEGQMGSSPAYLQFVIQGYPNFTGSNEMQFNMPQVRVYSVQELAKSNWGQNALVKLRALLANPVENPNPDTMTIPSAYPNAGVVTASNLKFLSTTTLTGMRTLTTFGQAVLPITNSTLMYQFHGLSTDGKFYILAIMPIKAPFLTDNFSTPLPESAAELNVDPATFDAETFKAYTNKAAEMLSAAETADTLTPSTIFLDGVIQSIKLNPATIILPTQLPVVEQPAEESTPTAAVAAVCDSAEFLADVTVKDATVFKPNEVFTKTWRLKNTGTCTWDNTYTAAVDNGQPMTPNTSYYILPAGSTVAPGGEVDISINMQAPSEPGSYRTYWRLKNGAGSALPIQNGFTGTMFYVDIVVKSDTGAANVPTLQPYVQLIEGVGCTQEAVYQISGVFTATGQYTGAYTLLPQVGTSSYFNGTIDVPQENFAFTSANETKSFTTYLRGPYPDITKLDVNFLIDNIIVDTIHLCP